MNIEFIDFLEDALLINEEVLNQGQIKIVKRWLEKNTPILLPVQIKNEEIAPEIKKTNEEWHTIFGNLNPTQINRFFDFLHEMKNSMGNPFLPKEKVMELKKMGLKYKKDTWSPTFTLDIKPKERFKIYSCFYYLWERNSEVKNAGKEQYALYLKSYFTNFDIKPKSIQDALEGETVNKVGFDIKPFLS